MTIISLDLHHETDVSTPVLAVSMPLVRTRSEIMESLETPFPPANPWRVISEMLRSSANPQDYSSSASVIQHRTEKRPAQNAALQDYLDQISQLLVKKDSRSPKEDVEVRALARARTLTVLDRLKSPDSSDLRRNVLQVLYERDLITRENPAISLAEADLSGASLFFTNLRGSSLCKIVLRKADLTYADLRETDLREADLSHSRLGGACLNYADLSGANLSGAEITDEQLATCNT